MWFIFALASTLLWGAADLFYKKGADEGDRYSHLKTSICVGLVMGLHAILTLIFGDIGYKFINLLIYLPVSLMYILSMAIGYFGLRYLDLSVNSPVQNSSGALVCIMCLVILGQTMDGVSACAVVLICVGVFLLGVFERARIETLSEEDRKYSIGFKAFMMPILYCIFDALGTFFDAYYLDDYEATPLRGVTEETFENVANISYELTFLIVALALIVYVVFIKHDTIKIPKQKDRLIAAVLETGGQFTYVFAMSGNGVVAAPMIASYSIVSVILSRLFLKERLAKKQYAAVALVIIGIALLGVMEGLAE